MSKISLSGNASGTGTFTIASPNSNTDRTLTLPDATGTILTTATPGVPVNGPAFSATKTGSNQSITPSTWTKIQFNTEEFDTNSCFDNTTNYRFTPTVAGYYQFSACGYLQSAGSTNTYISFYKNGTLIKYGQGTITSVATSVANASALIYLNGSTDYVELYAYINATSATVVADSTLTYFQAAMVRSAT
jgi:hypothetical protein